MFMPCRLSFMCKVLGTIAGHYSRKRAREPAELWCCRLVAKLDNSTGFEQIWNQNIVNGDFQGMMSWTLAACVAEKFSQKTAVSRFSVAGQAFDSKKSSLAKGLPSFGISLESATFPLVVQLGLKSSDTIAKGIARHQNGFVRKIRISLHCLLLTFGGEKRR